MAQSRCNMHEQLHRKCHNCFFLQVLYPLFLVAQVSALSSSSVRHLYGIPAVSPPTTARSITVHSPPCFPLILGFGDSLNDIGNNLASPIPQPSANLPYGETYFHKGNGRYSDGRLIIDFIPQTLGLPLLDAYLNQTANISNGKVFAVAGATAMDSQWLARRDIHTFTLNTLDVQLEWFKSYKTDVCKSLRLNGKLCTDHFSHALFFFGEIGGDDLNYPLFQGKSVSQVTTYIPFIIHKIKGALTNLIGEGARYVIVEGLPPTGCVPAYIQKWKGRGSYDSLGCVTTLNHLAQRHNTMLQHLVNSLRVKHPTVEFLYFDFYKAFYDVLQNAHEEGFTNTMDACYPRGLQPLIVIVPPRNSPGLCPHPETYANWDGIHSTEAMYKAISKRLLMKEGFQNPFPNFLTQRCTMSFPND